MSQGAAIKKVSVSEIKSKLLRPALTSNYVCNFQPPDTGFIKARVNTNSTKVYDRLTLACSDASLPGSSLATHEINNDYTGVTERHAYRRLYDERMDFSFYVDANEYYVIKLFEAWISYCVDEQLGSNPSKRTYNYRVNYPNDYCTDTLSITKFERDYSGNTLQYNFVKAFPISIQSIPVSYESSQLLKCTVSFTYSRYWVKGLTAANPESKKNENAPGVPDLSRFSDEQLEASYNRLTNPLSGQGYGKSDLESAAQRALSVTDTSDITINTFQN
jgi:hypothetical protein